MLSPVYYSISLRRHGRSLTWHSIGLGHCTNQHHQIFWSDPFAQGVSCDLSWQECLYFLIEDRKSDGDSDCRAGNGGTCQLAQDGLHSDRSQTGSTAVGSKVSGSKTKG